MKFVQLILKPLFQTFLKEIIKLQIYIITSDILPIQNGIMQAL